MIGFIVVLVVVVVGEVGGVTKVVELGADDASLPLLT